MLALRFGRCLGYSAFVGCAGAVVVALTGCGGKTTTSQASETAPLGQLLQPSEGERSLVEGTYRGRRVEPLSVDLRALPIAAYFNGLAPVVTASMNDRYVAYSTGTRDPKDLRLHVYDLRTGRDLAFGPGTTSAAWRADGAIAYFRGRNTVTPGGVTAFRGALFVRHIGAGRPVQWTSEPGRYVAFGWAGSRLVFARISEGEYVETFVADGPGRVRELGDGPPIAMSPDGTRVLIFAGGDGSGRDLLLIDLATGKVLHRLRTGALSSGDWKRELVVAGRGRTLLVLRVRNDRIAVVGTIRTSDTSWLEPRFTGTRLRRVVGRAARDVGDGAVFPQRPAVCVISTRRCRYGSTDPPLTGHHVVYAHSVASPTLPPPPDGRHFGYIRSLESRRGTITAVFDPATKHGGKAAQRAAAEDRLDAPGDYYIRNDDRSTTALRVAPDARVSVVISNPVSDRPGTMRGLLRSFADGRPGGVFQQGPGSQYWLTIRSGLVVAIAEQYLP